MVALNMLPDVAGDSLCDSRGISKRDPESESRDGPGDEPAIQFSERFKSGLGQTLIRPPTYGVELRPDAEPLQPLLFSARYVCSVHGPSP